MELTFLCLDVQSVLQQPLLHIPHMDVMLFESPEENQNIIQVHKNEHVQKIL